MQPAAEAMRDALEQTPMSTPVIPVMANVGASPLVDVAAIRASLVRQVTGTVRWRESVLAMASAGVTHFAELGSGKVLTGLGKRIAPDTLGISIQSPEDVAAFIAAQK